jgi:serine/threonine protein kinase/tetratricopeptide (TPR) repeat protein
MDDLTGQRLGHYRVAEKLGAGGMGEVYRAHDDRLGRDIAIKVLPESVGADRGRLARFEREARTVGRLNHPNILTIHDVGSVGGRPYLVTELLGGHTLREHIDREPSDISRALSIAAQVAEGLAVAHAKGVVHRDIKPENLFITDHGVVKILDFGLAKVLETDDEVADSDLAATRSLETVAGTILGTVGYMAPEQVRAEPTDARTDIFALGCVLYELLSGRRAFRATTAADTMTEILRDEPQSLAELGIEAPSTLNRILGRCLAKDPSDRYRSATELAGALHEAASRPSRASVEAKETRPSVAVLPFVNLSADSEQEYFCDGMAEEIINALARAEGLRVVSRTSSFAFKGKSEDIRAIGTKLEVGTVLEGSVRRSGDRLRIIAQLVNVKDGYHLWSERFERRLEDVFAIQDEISLAVVDSLKITLLGGERRAIVRRHTRNLEAYNLYLEGLHHWHKLTPEGYERSLDCFDRLLELDPGFAPALVWKGIWCISQCFWADVRPAEGVPEARRNVERALAIEPETPEAHSLLGVVLTFFERNREAGEATLRRAVELGPNLSQCHSNLAIHLLTAGKIDEAISEARIALRLDPLSVTNNAWVGGWLAYAGRLEEGVEQLRRTIEMHPQEWLPHHQLSEVHTACTHELEAARIEAEQAVELSGGLSVPLQQLAGVLYRLGRVDEADRIRERLHRRAQESYVAPTFLAHIALASGDGEAALGYIEQAARSQDPWLGLTRLFLPSFTGVDPRVEELLDRLDV